MSSYVPRTRWGGVADRCFDGSGFFRIVEGDVFWFADPDGGRFISKGVNTVRFDQDKIRGDGRIPYAEACTRKYGGVEAWRGAAAARLHGWGFNTLGAWSDEAVASAGAAPLAYAPNLDLGMSFAWGMGRGSGAGPLAFPDVFDPSFRTHAGNRAREICRPRAEDPHVLGWFIDNELRWAPDWRGADELLTLFLNLPTAQPGRAAAVNFLRTRHGDFPRLGAAWRTTARSWEELAVGAAGARALFHRAPPYQRCANDEEAANRTDSQRRAFFEDCDAFAALVAQRYFDITCMAIKDADPNHLILGCRFAYVPAPGVIEAAARKLDVISANCYDADPGDVITALDSAGKPCLIGEFSFRAADSGLPNTGGAGPLVETQAERAACFRRYVGEALKHPSLVGYHWFEHADQPAEGRFDGENSNFGTVTIDDREYEDLTRAMTAANAEAERLHAVLAPVSA